MISATVERQIAAALAAATELLSAKGFTPVTDRHWRGPLATWENTSIEGEIVLADDFPFTLPTVTVTRAQLPKRVPHVDKGGKICYAPTNGTLVVHRRPVDIVRDALSRARKVIESGLDGYADQDLLREFIPYWEANARDRAYSICDPNRASGDIVCAVVTSARHSQWSSAKVFADSHTQLRVWLGRLGAKVGSHSKALFFALTTHFDPPDFDDILTVRELQTRIEGRLSDSDREYFKRRLREASSLPLRVLISMPGADADDRVVCGLTIPKASNSDHGFRAGRVPLDVALLRAQRSSIQPLGIDRLDARYVTRRGGANPTLRQKKVVVVGCGAVGAPIASHLAAAGVGHLHLIDDEPLVAGNVHRHSLGVVDVGTLKVDSLRRRLSERFPHQEVTCDSSKIREALEIDSHRITSADLVVVAVGDPTVELFINCSLHGIVPRLHAWLEPYGLGGHWLRATKSGPGCFECIVDSSDAPLVNASLASTSRDFGQSFAGCAGTFTPFGELDADQVAIESAREAIALLCDAATESLLVSWMGSPTDFQARGFDLSDRGRTFAPGERRAEKRFVNPACPVCAP